MRQVKVDALDVLVLGGDHLQCVACAPANINKLPDIAESFEVLQQLADQDN